MPINIPMTAEGISKRTHMPLWAVKKALQLLRKRDLATQTPDGAWQATPQGEEAAEEVQDGE